MTNEEKIMQAQYDIAEVGCALKLACQMIEEWNVSPLGLSEKSIGTNFILKTAIERLDQCRKSLREIEDDETRNRLEASPETL